MTRSQNRRPIGLIVALAFSLTLHLLPFLPLADFGQKSASTAAVPLQAELRPSPLQPPPSPPPLKLPDPAPTPPAKPKKSPPPQVKDSKPARTWTQAVREHLKKLDTEGQFYPTEAIARGEQGEVQVLMMLDENGKVSAARIEQGSGYPLLDTAALRAIRSLSSLPADAPRQMILPVRFRLH